MITVLFLPYYDDNPYQAELARGLRSQDVTVVPGDHTAPAPVFQGFREHGRPDVVHLHWVDSLLVTRSRALSCLVALRLLVELAVARLLGVDVVWTVHNRFHHERRMPGVEYAFRRLLFRSSSAVIVHGQAARDDVVDAYDLPDDDADRVAVVPHGNYVDSYPSTVTRAAARDRLDLPADATVFLHVGNIRPYKNVPELVETFADLPGDDRRLVVSGRPPTDDDARARLERLCANETRTRLDLGFVPEEDLQVYLTAADAVVLPFSDVLTSGSVVLALSFGRPVVAPRLGCIPETVGDCDDLLYDPDRPDGLERALRRADRTDLDALGDRAAARAAELDWETIGRRTAAVYEQHDDPSASDTAEARATPSRP